jgi:hypothetical protein
MISEKNVRVPSENRQYRVAITVDIHKTDVVSEIDACNEWLRGRNIPATFFVPTVMPMMSKYKRVLGRLTTWEHEIGTQSHVHNADEIAVLQSDDSGDPGFLEFSKKTFEDFFGFAPRSFRAPCWSALSRRTLAELWRLGYGVDSTCTPQRLGIFSSYPAENPYLWSKRAPRFVYRSLLEIPTSAFVFPMGAPTFETFRRWGSRLFLRMLLLEARLNKDIIVTLMFHAGDFSPGSRLPNRPKRQMMDLIPTMPGGFGFKYWIRQTDPAKIFSTTCGLVECITGSHFDTLSRFYVDITARDGDNAGAESQVLDESRFCHAAD